MHDNDHDPVGESSAAPEAHNDELSPGETARLAREALFGQDLIAPAPPLWPFGRRARQRREQRHAVKQEALRRRRALRAEFHRSRPTAPTSGPWRPVDRRANITALAALGAVVAIVVALMWWFGGRDDHRPPAVAAPPAPPTSTPTSAAPAPPVREPGTSLPKWDPIPPGGVTPIVPPAPHAGPDPASVPVAGPPAGPPSAADLSTPESAAAAWVARWCPFDFRHPLGADVERARPAMTDAAWWSFDPRNNERARRSWQETVAAGETARCSAPQAEVIPEAPRTADSAIVRVRADRVVTSAQTAPYVEQVTETRVVRRGDDGTWRVDAATQGG